MKTLEINVTPFGEFTAVETPEGNYIAEVIDITKENLSTAGQLVELLEKCFPKSFTIGKIGDNHISIDNNLGYEYAFEITFYKRSVIGFSTSRRAHSRVLCNTNNVFEINYGSKLNTYSFFKKVYSHIGREFFATNKIKDILSTVIDGELNVRPFYDYEYDKELFVANGLVLHIDADLNVKLRGLYSESEYGEQYTNTRESIENEIKVLQADLAKFDEVEGLLKSIKK